MKTQVAMAAKEIRRELKKYSVKFSVKSSSYSMGDSISVEYTGGPSTDEVENLLAKYVDGKFDGMTDSYERFRDNGLPRTKYLFVKRNKTIDEHHTDALWLDSIFNRHGEISRDAIWHTM